jgi:hypothetical protein
LKNALLVILLPILIIVGFLNSFFLLGFGSKFSAQIIGGSVDFFRNLSVAASVADDISSKWS